MDALEQASQAPKIKEGSRSPSQPSPGRTNGHLNGIGESMFVVKGVSEQGLPLNLKVLLDTGADRPYVSRTIAAQIGKLRKGSTVLVDLPSGESISSNDHVKVLVRIGTYRLAVECTVIDLSGYDLVLGETWFRKANPQIDFARNAIHVRDRQGRHDLHLHGMQNTINRADSDLASFRTVRKIYLKKKSEGCLYFVRKSELPVLEDLPKDVPERFQGVIQQYSDCFRSELPELPPQRIFQHAIDTGDSKPVNHNAYPLSYSQLEEQTSQIQELLDKGLIRTSSSPWGFPVLFVKKPEGKWRMCIDYRGLNALTERNTYPLPRIQDCLDRIGSAKRISKLDLLSGFYQLRIEESSIPKTAFNTRHGKFEFLVMPFGLTNAPATFQTLMNTILQPYLDKFVVVYLDDIVVFSKSDEEHKEHLRLILEKLKENSLYAKPSKCVIGAETIEFCGHIVGQGQLRTSRSKTELIENWPAPTNVHEVRQFLGLASYYRRFVQNFATIAAPLSELLREKDETLRRKKNRPIIWTAKCQLSFELLKKALSNEPVLIQPDFLRPFVIETDASEWAIGCSLLQLGTDGKLHPVAFDGRKLQGAELNYAVQEKELLAIKHALRTWSYYIDNHHRTKILTDHESLKYLKDTKVPSKRLAHWIAEFGTYDLDIQYRPGTEATVPDAISRRPDFIGTGQAYQAQFNSIRSVDEYDWEQAMVAYLRTGEEPSDEKLRKAVLEDKNHPASSFVLEHDSLLYRKMDNGQAPYLAPLIRSVYLERIHRRYGHLGWPGLKDILKNRAWWPSIERDVQAQIGRCPECQAAKGPKTDSVRGPRHTLERTDIQLFDSWSIDLIGILPKTYNNNRWIITAIERSTGWPITEAVSDATSQTVIKFIHERIFSIYGIPNEILTDNGSNLVSEATESYLHSTSLKHRTTTPYHPQTNGKVERFNSTIGSMLTKYLYGKPVRMWDEYLSQATFAVRLRTHAVSKYSPFFLLYGVQPRLPEDPYEDVSEKTEAKIETILKRHAASNESRLQANTSLVEKAMKARLVQDELHKTGPTIGVGKYVLVRDENPAKFSPKWFGPYKVAMTALIGTYALEDCHGNIVRSLIHGSRLLELNDAVINKQTGKWKASYLTDRLRTDHNVVDLDKDACSWLERDSIPGFTYKDLDTVTKKEWIDMQSKGLDLSKLGEGKAGDISYEELIFQKLRSRVEALERKRDKEVQQEVVHAPTSTQLPQQISHSLERIVSVQTENPTAIPQEIPTQADVLMNESVQREPSFESGKGEGSLIESDAAVLMPAQMEAGRHDVSSEDLQPSNENPPPEKGEPSSTPQRKKPVQKIQEEQLDLAKEQRHERTGYALRHKPKKSRPKDL